MSDHGHIVIVGAGIGGLTAALCLARDGWKVDVYEQNHKIEPVGSGLQLAPNASRILDGLGLLPALRAHCVEPEGLTIRSGMQGRTVLQMPYGEAAMQRWGAPFMVIHRGDLQRVLLDAVAGNPLISLSLGRRLEEVRYTQSGVKAVFTRYNDELVVEPRALVAADGLWSKARAAVGLPHPAVFSGCVAWRTLIPVEAAPAFARELRSNLWMGPGAHVVHYPIRRGSHVNVVAIVEDGWRERGWSEPGDIAWINRRFETWHPDLKALIASAEGWLRWSLFDRPADSHWTRGPVTLLGDSAHPMLPFLAQGAAQAIEDASALAAALAAKSDDAAAAMKSYEANRLRKAARVQRESRRQARIYHAGSMVGMMRDTTLSFLGARGLSERYAWLYGKS